jgi:hypothetical protein
MGNELGLSLIHPLCGVHLHTGASGVWQARSVNVAFPDWRADVLAALTFLASEPPLPGDVLPEAAAPDLDSAVHWLVDDTFWDVHDATESIGTILRGPEEASAVNGLVAAVLAVADRHGNDASDATWFSDPDWVHVRALATFALNLFRG